MTKVDQAIAEIFTIHKKYGVNILAFASSANEVKMARNGMTKLEAIGMAELIKTVMLDEVKGDSPQVNPHQ